MALTSKLLKYWEYLGKEPNNYMNKQEMQRFREKICEEFGWNEEDNEEHIDKVFKLQKDRYTATQAKKKAKKDTEKTKKHFKTLAEKAKEEAKKAKPKEKDKKAKQKEEDKSLLSIEDKAYLYSKGYSRTELRHLNKVMDLTGKGWEKALSDNSFTSFKKDNDALIKRRGSTLGASTGGSTVSKGNVQSEVVEEFFKDLPAGLARKKD